MATYTLTREIPDSNLQGVAEALGVHYDPAKPPTTEELLIDIDSLASIPIDSALEKVFTKEELAKIQPQIEVLTEQVKAETAAKLEATKPSK